MGHGLEWVQSFSGPPDAFDVAWSADGTFLAASGTKGDVTVWSAEGHTSWVLAVRFSLNGDFLASASDSEVRLWRCRDWAPVAIIPRQEFNGFGGLAFHPSRPLLAVKELKSRRVDCLRIDYSLLADIKAGPSARRYANAKVVLLGDTGVGKSGLGL